jgi:signal transduction histidine kinase
MAVKSASPHIQSPFVGARPFERADAAWFFGRASEAHEIAPLIAKSRILILTGDAKTGKTSFLNAAILPYLERIAVDALPTVTFPAAITALPSETRNIFTIQALRQWRRSAGDWTLARYLEARPRIPTDTGDPLPRALIVDQAEHLFDAAPHRWQDRDSFIESVIAALAADPTLRAIFVIDAARALALLEYLRVDDRLPASCFALYTLSGLYEARALSAIIEPFQRADPPRCFAAGAVESLLTHLSGRSMTLADGSTHVYAGETVDLERLQIVCQSLWESLPAAVTEIAREHWQPLIDTYPTLAHPDDSHLRIEMRLRADNRRLREKLTTIKRILDGQRREIEAATLLRAMIVSTVAHEFNTPLLQIKSAIHLISEDPHQDRELVLRLANQAIAHLTTQVQNLTQLAETLDISPQPMNLRDSLDQALGSLRRLGVRKETLDRVQIDLSPRLPLVMADRKGIGIVLHHLIDNALKFSADPIRVSATATDEGVLIAVTDDGIGIAPEYHERIFDLFFQIDASTTKKYSGMGIGLAIVRLMLDNHRVRIHVHSQPSAGCTFTFVLPFSP